MNLRKALYDAEHLGCEVSKIYRTGELRVKAPDRDRTVKLNSRRKDCPRALSTIVQQLRRKKDGQWKSKSARSEGNQHSATGPRKLGVVGTLPPSEAAAPEEDLLGNQGQGHGGPIGHPPGQEPVIAPEERKRLQRELDGVIEEIRRLEAFYAKERHYRFKIPKRVEPSGQEKAEAKDGARLRRMEETAKKIGVLCCKREVLKANLRR